MASLVIGEGGVLKVHNKVGVGNAEDAIEEEGDHTGTVSAAPAMEVDVFLVSIGENLKGSLHVVVFGGVGDEVLISDGLEVRVFRRGEVGDGFALGVGSGL